MIPSVDDRFASIVRALTDVILPSLPPEAGLAQEQMQLVIGHIQILRAQIDAAPAFEAGEANDARELGETMLTACEGGPRVAAARDALKAALDASTTDRDTRVAIHAAIDTLVRASAQDGSPLFKAALGKMIIAHQTVRTLKDREWFKVMGFDAGM
jgi:hypothetical protein